MQSMLALPFRFAIPQPLYKEELLSIPDEDKAEMLELGMQIEVLPGDQVVRAQTYFNEQRRLKLNDCFALVLAEDTEDSILFTGDTPLKTFAESKSIEAHGVLWGIDMLDEHGDVSPELLLEALLGFERDPLVWLPEDELKSRIRRLRRKCR